jgi:hypothetical protein
MSLGYLLKLENCTLSLDLQLTLDKLSTPQSLIFRLRCKNLGHRVASEEDQEYDTKNKSRSATFKRQSMKSWL